MCNVNNLGLLSKRKKRKSLPIEPIKMAHKGGIDKFFPLSMFPNKTSSQDIKKYEDLKRGVKG